MSTTTYRDYAKEAQRVSKEQWNMMKPLMDAWIAQQEQHEQDQGIMRCDYCGTPSKQEHYCPSCGAPR